MNALEMFLKLGYKLADSEPHKLVFVKKNPDKNASYDFQVTFNSNDHTLTIADDWGDSYPTSIDLLQAIVFQIKELGWL
jgi:hypothetical protein